MSESIFTRDGDVFAPSEHASGPWDPRALHGGAPAALIVTALERHEPVTGAHLCRLGFELLRPIPFAPLTVTTRTVRTSSASPAARAHGGSRTRAWCPGSTRPGCRVPLSMLRPSAARSQRISKPSRVTASWRKAISVKPARRPYPGRRGPNRARRLAARAHIVTIRPGALSR